MVGIKVLSPDDSWNGKKTIGSASKASLLGGTAQGVSRRTYGRWNLKERNITIANGRKFEALVSKVCLAKMSNSPRVTPFQK